MNIIRTNDFTVYCRAEFIHPDYSSAYEEWFFVCNKEEIDNFEQIVGDYIRKNVNHFYHEVTLTTEEVIGDSVYTLKETYSVATGTRIKLHSELHKLESK